MNKIILNSFILFLTYFLRFNMKKKLRAILRVLLAVLSPEKKYIVFESNPELGGSPWMVYNALIKRGYNEKYKFVWFVDASYECLQEVCCIPYFGRRNFLSKLNGLMIIARAKLVIENNRFVYKINPQTFRLHAQHGAPLKNAPSYNKQIGDVDAVLSLSKNMVELEQKIFSLTTDKFAILGYPSNDCLWDDADLYKNGFIQNLSGSYQHYSKIIGWLPTFRQHKLAGASSDYVFPFGVPLLKSHDDFLQLNKTLKEKKVLLAIQMHHAQAKNFPVQNYSNIVMITQELKEMRNVSTANLMHDFDAMITDYSAAYHEYLLLDRPIALSIDDYEEYAKNPGFSIDYFDWIKGVYLKDISDLMKFIDDVANGVDSAKKERESAMHRIHKYTDNHSTQRVVDFLIEKANL